MQKNKLPSLFLASLFSFAVVFSPVFAQWSPAQYGGATGLPSSPILNIVFTLLIWLLGIFSIIAVIGFIISGIMYLTAAGDEEQQKRAKHALYYSITGVVVGLIGLVVLIAVNSLLSGASTRF